MQIAQKDIDYWTGHNITQHHQFKSPEESLNYLHWRNAQYPNYDKLMPCAGFDDQVVLDYGCGPGHDLVGFAHFSKPKQLIGLDVSKTSLAEADARLKLHGFNAEFITLSQNETRLPFENNSIDYIHSSGVLHHIPDHVSVLQEFERVLKPEGKIRIMVYNYNSIFLHLYVAYIKKMVEGLYQDQDIRSAFSRTTDGPDCPTSYLFTSKEFIDVASQASLDCRVLGAAISTYELSLLPQRFDAILNMNFPKEHRDFLLELRFNDRGWPLYEGEVAGVDACYELTKPK